MNIKIYYHYASGMENLRGAIKTCSATLKHIGKCIVIFRIKFVNYDHNMKSVSINITVER